MTILLVVAAPLCEEFIFRALVFRGLRGRFSFLPAALISASLFMIVHPPISWLPVFGLGIATAVAFEYGGLLIAPILVHAIYNAVILLVQA